MAIFGKPPSVSQKRGVAFVDGKPDGTVIGGQRPAELPGPR